MKIKTKEPSKPCIMSFRVPEYLAKKVKKKNLDVGAICREALQKELGKFDERPS